MTVDMLDRLMEAAPRDSLVTSMALSPEAYAALVETPTPDVTLAGKRETIHRTYEREHAADLVWHDSEEGRAWEVNRDALLTMQEMKRVRGISHYRGVPITRSDDATCVRWERVQDVLERAGRGVEALEILAVFANYGNWVGGGEFDPPGGNPIERARVLLGLESEEEDGE